MQLLPLGEELDEEAGAGGRPIVLPGQVLQIE